LVVGHSSFRPSKAELSPPPINGFDRLTTGWLRTYFYAEATKDRPNAERRRLGH
jgi:hypothetical protein